MLKRTDDPNVFEIYASTYDELLRSVSEMLDAIWCSPDYGKERHLYIKCLSIDPPLSWGDTRNFGITISSTLMSRLMWGHDTLGSIQDKQEFVTAYMLEVAREYIVWDYVRTCQERKKRASDTIIIDKRNEYAHEADDLCVNCDFSHYQEHNDRFEKPTSDCKVNAYDDIEEIRIPMINNEEKIIYYCPKRR